MSKKLALIVELKLGSHNWLKKIIKLKIRFCSMAKPIECVQCVQCTHTRW